ncbi:hypothetical protein SCHPADRAFT_700536 [Schizopora paradoxa]|uniref:DUF6533 domain-containing protein n=1 Tax=Schizopora paradoxa TaxID=27342 RepID=A0A0H2R441_9AGAM|nr:hypothetical protein SCHPADRAFT_700536 [Schizopora paradoxa]
MATLAELTTLLEQSVIVKYFYLSNAILLYYDTLLCLSDDIQFIWKARWTAGKVLYIMARYFAFIDLTLLVIYTQDIRLDPYHCKTVYQASAWFQVVGVLVAEILLIMRTYALFQKNKYVLAWLVAIEVGLTIPSIVMINNTLKHMIYVQSPAPTVLPCLPTSTDTMLWFAFMSIAINDLNVAVFTFYKGFSQWKSGMSRAPLLRTLYRDGGLYFTCLFVASLANVVLMKKKTDSAYFLMLIGFQRVLHAILTSRLIINVRKASEETWNHNLSDQGSRDKGAQNIPLQFASPVDVRSSFWNSTKSHHATIGGA